MQIQFMIDFSLKIDRKHPQRPSEILLSLLSSHKELMLENLRWRRAFGYEAELKIKEDLLQEKIKSLGISFLG